MKDSLIDECLPHFSDLTKRRNTILKNFCCCLFIFVYELNSSLLIIIDIRKIALVSQEKLAIHKSCKTKKIKHPISRFS